MLKKMVTAGTTLALFAGSLAVLTATPAVADPSTTASDPMATAIAAADRAVNAGYDSLTRTASDQYDRQQVYPWGNGTNLYSVAYERSYHGLRVVGGDAVVLVDGDGAIRQVNTATSATIDLDTDNASVKSDKAVSTAKKEQGATSKVESKRLVVHVKDDTQRLAWETVLRGTQKNGAPSHLTVWVDAQTGKVLAEHEDVSEGSGTGKWNGPSPLSIDTSQSGSTYYMKDTSRPGLQCSPYNGSVYSGPDDSWGNGNGTSTETGCVDAMYSAQQEWNMLRDWLGRTSHNGSGGSWPVSVGLNDQNAYWDGSSVTIGKNTAGNWISSMDVVGHEYGHGLDQFTPGGTSSEAGLGEATGDIFGALTEAYANQSATYDEPDYLVGEEINLVGTGPIRNMYNPSLVSNDPNCYSSAIPGTEVHAAAGPLNHWFYLMAEGSNPGGGKPTSPTCNSSTVTGMGVQTAGKVWFGGMMLKTSGMTYKKYRTATLTAAKNLDATCGLFNKTKAAWDAISVPAQTADPTCTGGGQDFTIALSPSSGTINAGASGTSTVSTTAVGSAQTVNLTTAVTGGTGVTATVSPASVTAGGSATLSITVASGSTGTRSITVTGTGTGSGTPVHSVTYSLTIGNPGTPDFSISASPGSGSTNPGGSLTTTVSTSTVTAPAQTVNLTGTATGGITVAFSPSSVTSGGSSTATISVPSGTAAGNYTVTITGTGTSATHSTTYSVTVNPTGGCTGGGNKIVNGGFESGTSPWTGQTGSIGDWSSYGQPAHSGTRTAYLDGYGYAATDAIAQSVTVPAGCTTTSLSFWIHIDTDETTGSVAYDVLTVTVGGTTVKTFSNLNAASGYVQVTIPLGSYAGQTTSIKFSGVEDASLQTSFVLDDVTFTVS